MIQTERLSVSTSELRYVLLLPDPIGPGDDHEERAFTACREQNPPRPTPYVLAARRLDVLAKDIQHVLPERRARGIDPAERRDAPVGVPHAFLDDALRRTATRPWFALGGDIYALCSVIGPCI